MVMRLDALEQGEHAYVQEIHAPPAMARRLTDLGLVPGTRVEHELTGFWGDPAAYRIRGTLIALRRRDAAAVTVSPSPPQGQEGET